MKTKKKLSNSNRKKINIGGLSLKQVRDCKCDTNEFCDVHQGDCDKHAYLCGDGSCTCKKISKEEAIKFKKLAKTIS